MTQEKIVDAITGDITYRDYTEEELAEREKQRIEMNKHLEEIAAKEAKRQEVLAKLGLTAEEAKALLG